MIYKDKILLEHCTKIVFVQRTGSSRDLKQWLDVIELLDKLNAMKNGTSYRYKKITLSTARPFKDISSV